MNVVEESLLEKIKLITKEINKKKGEETITIDLSPIDNSPCDFFIICSGKSSTQIKSIAKSIEKKINERLNIKPWNKEGENSNWMLIDYIDIVVHIFKKETRDIYDLQGLWNDGIIKKISREE